MISDNKKDFFELSANVGTRFICKMCANEVGIKAIVQPGGSMRDQDSIDACDKNGMTMVFTGIRHFKH